MLLDLRSLRDTSCLEADLCVVGAGAAGLTLAHELAGAPFRVCIVESGSLRSDHAAQALFEGENTGRPYFPLETIRFSGFGGTTSVWNGACRPLDPVDFCVRDWVPDSGWPFGRDELDPYYARAQKIVQLGPFTYDVDDWETESEHRLPLSRDCIDTHIFQLSPPTRFGRVYRRAIVSAPNLITCLHAHAVEIETNETGQHASRIVLRTIDGREFRIAARMFVLAAGAIENTRLLLLSRNAIPAGLGNQYGLVGRFFMEHLYLESGDLTLSDGYTHSRLYSIHRSPQFGLRTKIEAVLAVSEQIQRRERLLRCGFHFPPRWRTGRAFNSKAVTSLIYLVRLLRLGHVPYRWREHAQTTIGGFRDVLTATQGRLLGAHFAPNRMAMRAFAEQAPNADSRILLSNKRDHLGRNLVRIDWRLTDADLRSIRLSHEMLAAELQRSGIGFADAQLDSADRIWPARLRGGYHQMGTTRMHSNPRKGVVDADCKIHGTSNVYVAGSSVFPTAGYANPTLTIVALAVRLADHIKGLMS